VERCNWPIGHFGRPLFRGHRPYCKIALDFHRLGHCNYYRYHRRSRVEGCRA
jgi:hypothetical protein